MSKKEIENILRDIVSAISDIQETKIVQIPLAVTKKKKAEKEEKIKKKRVVTQEKKWITNLCKDDFDVENQHVFIQTNDVKQQILQREINNKISGYRRQDIDKNLYEKEKFVTFTFVWSLLHKSRDCFYCKEAVKLLYEISRDPKQWTLERINNVYGHNIDNVVICCLSCNIRRRTMYFEKYRFTKQTKFVKENS